MYSILQKINKSGFSILLATIILTILISFSGRNSFTVSAVQQNTCPDGGGWTKIDSSDLSLYPVDDATNYCFKFGSDKSEGCIGGISDVWPPVVDGKYCGLSHWSYYIPSSATPSPSISPSPTPFRVPNLKLTSMCWEDEDSHSFRVRNGNDFSVDYEVKVYGVTSWMGGYTADPGDSFFTITGTYGQANTTKIRWLDQDENWKETTKAVNQNFCETRETPTPSPTETPTPSPTPTVLRDVCANIDGIQTSVPEGLHLDASGQNCVAFELGGPPAPPEAGGEVLGAQTGQVLGLSATSSSDSPNTYLFWLGIMMLTAGVKLTGDYLYARNKS